MAVPDIKIRYADETFVKFRFDGKPRGYGEIGLYQIPYIKFLRGAVEPPYAHICSFFPNGKSCPRKYERAGRGQAMLDSMTEVALGEEIETMTVYTIKQKMRKFLVKNSFESIGKGFYIRNL